MDSDRSSPAEIYGKTGLISADSGFYDRIGEEISSKRPLLIQGPRGSGKTEVAKAILNLGQSGNKIVSIDCEVYRQSTGSTTNDTAVDAFQKKLKREVQGDYVTSIIFDNVEFLPIECQSWIAGLVDDSDHVKGHESADLFRGHRLIFTTTCEDLESAIARHLLKGISSAHIKLPGISKRRGLIPCVVRDFLLSFGAKSVDWDFLVFCVLNEWQSNFRELREFCRVAADHALDNRVELVGPVLTFYGDRINPEEELIRHFAPATKKIFNSDHSELVTLKAKPKALISYMEFLRFASTEVDCSFLLPPEPIEFEQIPKFDPNELISHGRLIGRGSVTLANEEDRQFDALLRPILELIESQEWLEMFAKINDRANTGSGDSASEGISNQKKPQEEFKIFESDQTITHKEVHAALTPIYSLKHPQTFADIGLRLLEDRVHIRVYMPGQKEGRRVLYKDLGMGNNKTGKPICLWELLLTCVENGGKLPQLPDGSKKERDKLKSIKRRIKVKLCVAFGTDEDPFSLLADGTGYQLKCRIEEEQHGNRESLETDLGTDIETIDAKHKLLYGSRKNTRHRDDNE